jgi:poly-beta-1,6-N-acetyl-D-glucosamine synthase
LSDDGDKDESDVPMNQSKPLTPANTPGTATHLRCSVGVIANNHAATILPLLNALEDQHLHRVEIAEIIVVVSGCTDLTAEIVATFAADHPQVRWIEQPVWLGRTHAVNAFLAECTTDICVLENGDTLPHEYAVENLVRMFVDPTIGMVGAQKALPELPTHITGLLNYLRTRMEHQLCLDIPRLSEMVAFRKVFDAIPAGTTVDEAFVEALIVRNGLSLRYAPDAIVYLSGPSTLADFMAQRRQSHEGYLHLKHRYGYTVSSLRRRSVLKVAFGEFVNVLRLAWVIFLLAGVELWSRILGWYDFAVLRNRHVVWDMAWSQKHDVQSERAKREKKTER